jgi:hypothetical protein
MRPAKVELTPEQITALGVNVKGFSEPAGWELVDLSPILAGETLEDPPSMLLREDGRGLVYRGKVHAVSGEPEATKGWVALAGGAERMAVGEHVLYIDFEDAATTAVARLRALGVPDEKIREHFHYSAPTDPLRVMWGTWHRRGPPSWSSTGSRRP